MFKYAFSFLSLLLITGGVRAQQPGESYFEASKNLEIFTNAFKELHSYYVDPVEPGRLVKVAMDAMLDGLDPYTSYITESDIEEYEFQMTGRYGGIGASMRQKDGLTLVGDVYEGSPAQKAGLHPGDIVISIDNQPLKGKTQDGIGDLLKGSPGTVINMQIKDAYSGEESAKMVTRGEIELSSVPYAALMGTAQDVAYVKLTQFTPGCTRAVRTALDSLKIVQPALKGVIVDLRNNPGGLLDEAVNMCNLFVERGQLIVSTKGKMQEWDKEYTAPGSAWDAKIPVTVLVNHSSASASEIVSGTLQDLDRGVVIGQRSYGKGLVQTTRPLGYNARLKLTTAKYYTPSGRCIQALDYTNRNANGSVGAIPDSLRKSYKTKSGRTVLSGGGVEPDVLIKDTPVSKLAATLYAKNFLFDYATLYARAHPSIAPATRFSLSTSEWDAFAQWLSGKDYSYKTETEEMLDSLQSLAKIEKSYEDAKVEFAALRVKVSHDKKLDLTRNAAEVRHMLENEIIGRYYYQRGRIAHELRSDKDVAKATGLLTAPTEYSALLK